MAGNNLDVRRSRMNQAPSCYLGIFILISDFHLFQTGFLCIWNLELQVYIFKLTPQRRGGSVVLSVLSLQEWLDCLPAAQTVHSPWKREADNHGQQGGGVNVHRDDHRKLSRQIWEGHLVEFLR
jgi:hypothetical protein